MPTYYALGITATLSVADLQGSLSNVVELKGSEEQRNDAKRVNDVLNAGTPLAEQAVSGDGEGKGVQRFLGENEDMPFSMVIAADGVKLVKAEKEEGQSKIAKDASKASSTQLDAQRDSTGSPPGTLPGRPKDIPRRARRAEPGSISPCVEITAHGTARKKPASSTATTPSKATPRKPTSRKPVTPSKPSSSALRNTFKGSFTPNKSSSSMLSQPRGFLASAVAPKALSLTLETSNKSFLNDGRAKRSAGKELKMEVFLNGQLAGSSYVNRRGSAVEFVDNKVRFAGTRVHRQCEKPWTYDSTIAFIGGSSSHAENTWSAVSRSLMAEANARGKDKWGGLPPSAEFLQALSGVLLPARLQGKHGVGIIDVVITAGVGKKYGPEHGYLSAPSRMDDERYRILDTTPVTVDPFADGLTVLATAAEKASPLRPRGLSIHSDGLANPPTKPDGGVQRRDPATSKLPETPTRKQRKPAEELAKEFGLEGVDLKMVLDGYESTKCRGGQAGRTVIQRLGDVVKMNPINREKHLAELKAQLNEHWIKANPKKEAGLDLDEKATLVTRADDQPSPPKKVKLDVTDSLVPAKLDHRRSSPWMSGFTAEELAGAAELVGEDLFYPKSDRGFIDPRDVLHQPPSSSPTELDAVLAQKRIDMALAAGAPSAGHLLQRIASTSPTKTPQKKTRAAALAGSPCRVPVKPQFTPSGRPKKTATQILDADGEPISIDPALLPNPTTPTPKSGRSANPFGRGSNRTRHAWDPTEKSPQKVLEDFVVPELCKGSCVSLAEGEGVVRQVGKARGGTFHEDEVVWGGRFVVL